MKILTIILLAVIFKTSIGQNKAKMRSRYSICTWDNLVLDKNYLINNTDTCLFIVSTRNYDDTKKEFVDYKYDTSHTLKYFAVYFKGDNWTVVPYPSLEKLLDLKESFKDMAVFTEGLGKTFTSGIDRATRLMRIYNIDEIFFDWPTLQPSLRSGKNLRVTNKISGKVALPYAAFLEEFQSYKMSHVSKFKTTTIFFHSMGNLILMHDLKKDLLKNIQPGLVDNVLLNAACVPQKKHAKWLNKLNFSKNIYVTINKKDRNLNGAKLFFLRHQLGEKVKKPLSKNAHYVYFTDVLANEHNYYLMRPLLAQKPFLKKFYADIFEGRTPVMIYPKIN